MPKYTLINPTIVGTFESTFEEDNSLIAAKNAYTELSKHFNNHIPVMYMTLQKGGGKEGKKKKKGKLYNFKIEEHRDNNELSFNIEVVDNIVDHAAEKAFIGARNDFLKSLKEDPSQLGGKSDSKDDDVVSDLIKTELLRRILPWISYNDPIGVYWYRPLLYGSYIDWYLPSWFVSLSPYVVISNSPWW
jgi:hypothetical protein